MAAGPSAPRPPTPGHSSEAHRGLRACVPCCCWGLWRGVVKSGEQARGRGRIGAVAVPLGVERLEARLGVRRLPLHLLLRALEGRGDKVVVLLRERLQALHLHQLLVELRREQQLQEAAVPRVGILGGPCCVHRGGEIKSLGEATPARGKLRGASGGGMQMRQCAGAVHRARAERGMRSLSGIASRSTRFNRAPVRLQRGGGDARSEQGAKAELAPLAMRVHLLAFAVEGGEGLQPLPWPFALSDTSLRCTLSRSLRFKMAGASSACSRRCCCPCSPPTTCTRA